MQTDQTFPFGFVQVSIAILAWGAAENKWVCWKTFLIYFMIDNPVKFMHID